ncbi:MAG TPA: GNAT family N-acetyltransferase [Acidimicrobiales bacterium]|nr:GNAT family N-acetyltransferase [Acidimicrobiales bacterium]
MKAVAETDRVGLWPWSDADAEVLALLGTDEVVRYLGGLPWTVDTAWASIELWRQIERRLGITTWAVKLSDTGELIGTCGFAGTNVSWLRFDFVIEIGWTLGRPWWRQGLATEAARAALEIGLAFYPAERIISKCHPENLASERVMRRLGMRRIGLIQGNWSQPTLLYRLPPQSR